MIKTIKDYETEETCQQMINIFYIYLTETPKNIENQRRYEVDVNFYFHDLLSKALEPKEFSTTKKPYIINGIWVDRRLAIKFLKKAATFPTSCDFTPVMFILSYLMRKSDELDEEIVPMINSFYNICQRDLTKMMPVYFRYILNKGIFPHCHLANFDPKSDIPTIYSNSCKVFTNMKIVIPNPTILSDLEK